MNQPKRYLDIVLDIRKMISQEKIRPGDRIPSERELAETLKVGRSTIREALRSLELLGLIETRRGEGTFLSDHRNHQLVEVLSTFILQDNQSQKDVWETRMIHEISAIQTICGNESACQLPVWDSFSKRIEEEESFLREDLVKEIMVLSGNRLSLKIWLLLAQYSGNFYKSRVTMDETEMIEDVLAAIRQQDAEKAASSLKIWIAWLQKESKKDDDDT
ncbi:GntR family transcriptional regulator [Planomicrobium sp. Y74]|uniref:FadR/GntR family transcriptional regulator n=1 Tax=Planomicrobium sp. Y74 TaxID=2478977 RepID=UPI000EF4B4FF|nr:GntR family transcriptional regulator [Planomicrobium sp. Y74]RLQ91884.1 FadR family transcriptional regulator [Planomicrobium sp. Y74]